MEWFVIVVVVVAVVVVVIVVVVVVMEWFGALETHKYHHQQQIPQCQPNHRILCMPLFERNGENIPEVQSRQSASLSLQYSFLVFICSEARCLSIFFARRIFFYSFKCIRSIMCLFARISFHEDLILQISLNCVKESSNFFPIRLYFYEIHRVH